MATVDGGIILLIFYDIFVITAGLIFQGYLDSSLELIVACHQYPKYSRRYFLTLYFFTACQ